MLQMPFARKLPNRPADSGSASRISGEDLLDGSQSTQYMQFIDHFGTKTKVLCQGLKVLFLANAWLCGW